MLHNKVDLHMHSDYSDGTCGPKEILDKAREMGVSIIAITDHDTLSALPEMSKLDLTGINFIPGVEISCESGGYSYHILAYNFAIDKLQEIVSKGNRLGRQKIVDMIEYLASEWKIYLSDEDIKELMKKKSPRKPDLGKLLVSYGAAPDLETAIHNILNNFPSDKTYKLNIKEATEAIHNAGNGIAVWAHPLRGKGNVIFSENEFLQRYEYVKNDIDGLEAFYSMFGKKEYEYLEMFAKNHNLLISAGSDFHGAHKMVEFGQLNKEKEAIDISRITILDNLL